MFEKILIMSDGSPVSDSLLPCVAELKRLGCQQAVLCHIIDVETAAGLQDEITRQLRPKLEQQQEQLRAQGIEASIEIPTGLVHIEVNRLVVEQGCSLIVVASHSHNLARDLLVGVNACSVIRHARVPVLISRVEVLEQGRRCRALCSDLFRHVLFPTDFSDTAEEAFTGLEDLVAQTPARVTLLHVQDSIRIEPYLHDRLEEFNRIDRERLERMAAALGERGATEVDYRLALGHPVQEILKEAVSGDYTLIVLGSQGRGYFTQEILGGVAHRVMNHASQPVLLVPSPDNISA